MAAPRQRTTTRAKRASVQEQAATRPPATRNGAVARARQTGERIGVRKTYKLYIGGQFPRTESGRAYEVFDAGGELLANASRGTRKDIRDAVRAARGAQAGWAAKTAYNRSQILYRIAELMEGRRDQFAQRRASPPPEPAGSSTPRSTAGCGTRAGRTSTRRSSAP